MTSRPLYPGGRASALTGVSHAGRTDYDLVSHLRAIRTDGDEAMFAVERYDPDFSLKLAASSGADAAEKLLAEWLERRIAMLKRTQTELRRVWSEAKANYPQRT